MPGSTLYGFGFGVEELWASSHRQAGVAHCRDGKRVLETEKN